MTTTILLVVGCFVFLAIGSFVCVIIDRLPHKLDEPDEFGDVWGSRPWREVIHGKSRCSSCSAVIKAYDNVPVASYVALRGKCRSCGARIPGYHPLVELAAPVAFVLALWVLGTTWLLAPVLWFIPVALAVAVIDLRTLIVPTAIVWPATGVLVAVSVGAAGLTGEWGRLLVALIGVAVVAGPLFLLWFAIPAGMGFGDVRLAVSVGLLVGFYGGTRPMAGVALGVITLLAASALGLLIGFVALGVRGRKAQVPFGPGFVLGGFGVALMAEPILESWGLYAT
ncbi:MAG: prepilin peptidase [Actinomycetia bacterium]|nr:prepilin peptidase [Actinomycetes bacterium]